VEAQAFVHMSPHEHLFSTIVLKNVFRQSDGWMMEKFQFVFEILLAVTNAMNETFRASDDLN
jgi:hypothetical protein